MIPRTSLPRFAMAGLGAALVLGGQVILAIPAGAVTGSVLVTITSASNSVNKNVTANCPAGTQVLGGGGKVLNGSSNVLLTDVVPNSGLTEVTVEGGENGPFAGNWQVMAYAICAPGTALNLTRVMTPAANNGTSDPYHSATAVCPAGQVLFGTGFQLSGANANAFIDDLVPAAGLGSVQVGAYENAGFTGLWDLNAIGVCGTPQPNQQLLSDVSSFDASTPKPVDAPACPAGTTATGGGAVLNGATGDVLIDEWHPNPSLTRFTARGQANAGFAGSWNLRTYVICA